MIPFKTIKNSEFKIKNLGTLKYSRLKSLSVLRKELNSYGYVYTIVELKMLLDSIINNKFEDYFDLKFKICLDKIFEKTEYIEYDNYPLERNFPDNRLPLIG